MGLRTAHDYQHALRRGRAREAGLVWLRAEPIPKAFCSLIHNWPKTLAANVKQATDNLRRPRTSALAPLVTNLDTAACFPCSQTLQAAGKEAVVQAGLKGILHCA